MRNRSKVQKADEVRQWDRLGFKVFWYEVSDTPGLEDEAEWIQVERGDHERGTQEIIYQGPDGERFSAFRHGFNVARRVFTFWSPSLELTEPKEEGVSR